MDDLLHDGHGAYVSRRRVTLAGVHFSPAAIAGVRVLEVKGGQSFIAAMWLAIVVAFPVGFIAHVLNSFQWLAIAVLSGCAAAIGIMIAPRVSVATPPAPQCPPGPWPWMPFVRRRRKPPTDNKCPCR